MDREAGVGEEMREVEQELEEKEHDLARRDRKNSNPHSLESGYIASRSPSPSKGGSKGAGSGGLTNLFSLLLSPAWVQTFIMTFLGEWGDRSQIATIAMAAGQDYWWVTLGAISGHAICTGLAVLGGRALAGRVSMRVGKFNLSDLSSVERLANKFGSHDRRRRCILGFRRAVPLGGVLRKIDLVGSGRTTVQSSSGSDLWE
jgi:putative Ca2+/H+ antiporter (TMEM165/GDT1 family)